MNRKLVRFFAFSSVFLVLLLSLQTVVAAEEPPMMSPGFSHDSEFYVDAPVPVEVVYHLSSGYDIVVTVLPSFSNLYDGSTQITSETTTYIPSAGLDLYFSEMYTSFEYDNYATLFYQSPFGSASCVMSSTWYPYQFATLDSVEIRARNFYYDPKDGMLDHHSELNFSMKYTDAYGMDTVGDFLMRYSYVGEEDENTYSYDQTLTNDYFELDPGSNASFAGSDKLVYVYYCSLTIDCDGASDLAWSGCNDTFIYSCYYDDWRMMDVESYDPPPSPMDPGIFADYTSWIGLATTGFLDLEIVQGFTIGGILMTIIGFLIAIWFLKLVAGG